MDEKAVKSMEEIAGSLLSAGRGSDYGGYDLGYYNDSCAIPPDPPKQTSSQDDADGTYEPRLRMTADEI